MRTDWIYDILIGISAIFIFGFMLVWMQKFIPNPFGYIVAFAVFIAYLTIMGLTVIKKHVGENPVKKKKTLKE